MEVEGRAKKKHKEEIAENYEYRYASRRDKDIQPRRKKRKCTEPELEAVTEYKRAAEKMESEAACENGREFQPRKKHIYWNKLSEVCSDYHTLEEKIKERVGVNGRESSSEDDKNIQQSKKYVMWLNDSNSCWLDATLALVAHNKTLRRIIDSNRKTKINEIIVVYDQATCTVNGAMKLHKERLREAFQKSKEFKLRFHSYLYESQVENTQKVLAGRVKLNELEKNTAEQLSRFKEDLRQKLTEAREYLNEVRNNIHQYLQPRLKCEKGEPDSAFCSLLNLVMEDGFYKQHFEVSWLWTKKCSYCGASHSCKRVKPIITLPKVKIFRPDKPTCLYQCACSERDQEMMLTYIEIPSCLIFHFENGAGKEKSLALSFSFKDNKFQLTGIVTLQKFDDSEVDHFITWIRDPLREEWLQCNDLIENLSAFSTEIPEFQMKNIYMLVYESNHTGRITNDAFAYEEIETSNLDIPCINISDDEGNHSVDERESPFGKLADGNMSDFLRSRSLSPNNAPLNRDKLSEAKKS